MKAKDTKRKTRTGAVRRIGALFLALTMLFGTWTTALAADVPAPTIDKVFYDATTVSGGNVKRGRIDGKQARGTIHVTVKDGNGNVKATLSVTPRSGTTWTVNLPDGKKIEPGDTVTAYQVFDGSTSPEATANAEPSKAYGHKNDLKMPVGEIWIEQTSSNIVNADEQAEARSMFDNVNTAIAADIKSVKFSIEGTDHAYYEVTYTDGSTSGKVEAPDLTIHQVTETSRGATLDKITIVDNKITGKLSGEGPFDGIKVQIVTKVSENAKETYCNEGKCKTDKDSSNPVDATVNSETGEFTYTLQSSDKLERDQTVGVSVKEPRKLISCSTTTVGLPTVKKTDVRDPHKLTDKDKAAIEEAISKAYTGADGKSKLPNGTGDWDGVSAVIQIDDSGNAKIFSGNDVAGYWDANNNYQFVPEKNEDGSYKLKDGAVPTATFPAKDLVRNIAPKSPAIAVDTDKGEVTITPPAYTNPGDDTDLASYTLTYKDASGTEKTITATRKVDAGKTTWSVSEGATIDATTGVITLDVDGIELGGTLTAKAKDNGGLEGDTTPLESAPATQKLETATVTYDANGGTGKMEGKKVNKGSKYTVLGNTFTAPANQEFDTWEVDGKKVAAGIKITVTKTP